MRLITEQIEWARFYNAVPNIACFDLHAVVYVKRKIAIKLLTTITELERRVV